MSAVRVAIVDDARFIREALVRLLADDPRIEVVGAASSGEELLNRLDVWAPDAVTLDLEMPGLGGLETLRRLMERRPTPVIILSTHSGEGAPATMEALSYGAADFVDKEAYSLVDFRALREVLVTRLLQVGTRRRSPLAALLPPGPAAPPRASTTVRVLVIGASTGGPRAVEQVLRTVGADLNVPVLVVQHMPVGFTRAFAQRLDKALPFPVAEATHGGHVLPGEAVVAPAGMHCTVVADGDTLVTHLQERPTDSIHRPSIDLAMRSIADVTGARAIGVLLTGMGADGAAGLLEMFRHGAYTIAEAETTCVVYGMPRAAVLMGAVQESLPLHAIGERVRQLIADEPSEADPITSGASSSGEEL